MLSPKSCALEKRKELKDRLNQGKLLRFPGAFSPLVAKLIEEIGYDGIYISGAVLSNDLGLPDIGLTTLEEVTRRGKEISKASVLPSIIDLDTGFGGPINTARAIREAELAGLAGCHIEDQTHPKRCGHLDNKELISANEMSMKIKAAAGAKTDSNFLLIARTDAKANEGIEKAIDRAKAYVDAGAEMIFPEALHDEKEFEAFRKAVEVPLLCNMTEFGKTKLLNKQTLDNLGYNIVIYPVTSLRLAMKAVEDGLEDIYKEGSQKKLLDKMQTRKRLYELVDYESYNQFDKNIYDFKMTEEDG